MPPLGFQPMMLSVGNQCIIPAISALKEKKTISHHACQGGEGFPLDSEEIRSCTHLRKQRILYAIQRR